MSKGVKTKIEMMTIPPEDASPPPPRYGGENEPARTDRLLPEISSLLKNTPSFDSFSYIGGIP